MGNELLDGWLHLPIPVFERVSQLAEEVFQASQAYLDAVRSGGILAEPVRSGHEGTIRAILDRVRLTPNAEGGPRSAE
jgi:hypothetical protein